MRSHCPHSALSPATLDPRPRRIAVLVVWLSVLLFLAPVSSRMAHGAPETLHLRCRLVTPTSDSELQVRAHLPHSYRRGSMDIVMVEADDGKDIAEGPLDLVSAGDGYEGGFTLAIPESEVPPEMSEWADLMPTTFVQFRLLPTAAGPSAPSGWRVESRIEATMNFGGVSQTQVDEGGKGPCTPMPPEEIDRRFQNAKAAADR